MARKSKGETQQRSGSESSAYYITPEHNVDDGVEYYVDFDEDHLDHPYVDASESLFYTDSQYSTESDLHLQQQKKQKHFVTSSSLELQSENEDIHIQAAEMMNDTTSQQPRKYQNCLPKRKNSESKKTKPSVGEVSCQQLTTEYTNAEVLERSTIS